MINLLFGCAGSGKTRFITEKIKSSIEQERRTYLLVPEQQVFTAEKLLLELPYKAGLYFEVISFSRMCELVFSKYGGLGYNTVSGGVRNLIMWESIRQVHSALASYGETPPDARLAALMLATADELAANSVTSTKLEEVIKKMKRSELEEDIGEAKSSELEKNIGEAKSSELEKDTKKANRPDLQNKLSDISAVMEAYKINLSKALGEGALAAENRFERLYATLRDHEFFAGADVYVDSFTDFTGIQHKILAQIMKQADCMYISVNVKERGYHASHTVSATETLKRLTADARASGRDFEDITLGGNTRTQSPQLKLLEKHLWDFGAKKSDLPEIPENMSHDIELIRCENEYEETECVALKILEARRNNMKYSDIAVILRNPEERSGIINAVFSKYNIPFFISEKTGLTSTPASRFILSSLRCVTKNYRLDDVLTLLKTGLCGVDYKDADLFEEYCLTWNIQGSTFTEKSWSMNPNGFVKDKNERIDEILAAANKVRKILIEPLEELRIKLTVAEKNATELCRALYAYMEKRNLAQMLCRAAETELETGGMSGVKDAGEIIRVYDALLSAISGLCAVLGDSELTNTEFMTALEIMLSHTELASVPALGDCVTVGSASTLRVENIKLAIVMEMCEGIFPAVPGDTGLLCESDKEILGEHDIPFKSRRARLMSDELFYVYRALTKPSESLIVTTYASSISGGSKSPSVPWHRIVALFGIEEETIDLKSIKKFVKKQTEGSTLEGEECPSENETLTACEAAEETAEKTVEETAEETVEEAVEETADSFEVISPDIIRAAFAQGIYLSKSKIQNFVKCPMLYWSKHVLDLRARESAQVSASESGTLVHYVLEKLFDEIRDKDTHILAKKSPDEILELTNKWVDRYITETNCPRSPALMFSFSKLRNMAYLMANDIYKEFSASEFRMFSFEQNISQRDGALKPFTVELSEFEGKPKVYLGGNADRVDTYTKDGVTYVRVIDYKTGNVAFDETKVPTGADLQLPAYLFAVTSEENMNRFTNGGDIFAAASLYVSAVESAGDISIARSGMIYNDPNFLRATNENLDYRYISTAAYNAAQKNKLNTCSELFSKEKIEEMRDVLTATVKETSRQIYSGVAKRTPSAESCKYCPMRASCSVACKSKY